LPKISKLLFTSEEIFALNLSVFVIFAKDIVVAACIKIVLCPKSELYQLSGAISKKKCELTTTKFGTYNINCAAKEHD